MCRYCEPKMPYGIEPLAEAKFLNDILITANLSYLTYGSYMLEIVCQKDSEQAKKVIECNYFPKCGRPLHFKRKK